MIVPFIDSPNFTVGIELELFIIDSHTKKTVSATPQLLEKLHQAGYLRFKNEFNQSTLEIESPISPTIPFCRSAIASDLSMLHTLLEQQELSVIAAATHPFSSWLEMEPFPAERYTKLIEKMQMIAKRISVCGLHVHVGLPTGEDALAVMNSSLQYLPHLLALSANSPYWNGVDTGLESFRFSVMNSIPYAGIPPYFSSWQEFSDFFYILQERKVVEKMKDVYWHVRPSPDFGTIEFRICDIPPSLDEIMALTALVQCLVLWTLNDLKSHPEKQQKNEVLYALLPENIMRAQRYGVEGKIFIGETKGPIKIKEDLERLLTLLTPLAVELGCREELNFIHRMMAVGNGAGRQRRCFKETGSYHEVVRMLEGEFALTRYGEIEEPLRSQLADVQHNV